jgi:RNA polymerase sigma-70 factor (ECF subfamily)
VVAALLRRYGDFDLAEDCTQDALLAAVRVWLSSGIPQRPGAWLTTAARRRALDRLRRRQGLQAKLAQSPPAVVEGGDDRLRLMFTCCHPALSREAQLALTLRTVAGFRRPWRNG